MKRKIIIMIGGLPGTGKSYLAKIIHEVVRSEYLSSDQIRKELKMSGQYSDKDKEEVYEELIDSVNKKLQYQSIILVDTTFQKRELRNKIIELAIKNSAEFYFILTTASEETIKKRISIQRDDSEANYEVYKFIKQFYEPVLMSHIKVNTDNIRNEEMITKVLTYCKITE